MNKIIFLALFLTSALISDSNVKSKEDQKKVDKVKIKNPEAQNEINRLKREFKEDRDLLQKEYELMIKDLKEERKGKIRELRGEYRKRLQELRNKYPDIPDINLDSKPKQRLKPPKDDNNPNKKDKSFRKKKNKRKIKGNNLSPVEAKPSNQKKEEKE